MARSFLPCGAALALLAVPTLVAAQSGPVAAVTSYNAGINAIETGGGGLAQRADKFEALVRRTYDMPAIAALVVGPGWAQASAADKSRAIAALTRHSAVSLAKNFKGPTATAFTVSPQPIQRGGSAIVRVTVDKTVLFYRMRGDKIIDVIADGVSQLALQRADLAGTVASGGIAAMVKKLGQLDTVS
ncbi:ABC transporter substrate-binding protein [Sphingomonas morindae]|uniref:ABC transporter substrate-binding protein n=1 Tax=Sphingomonas morindae TaxID=1541170 RepID=A0ABY4X489_9SPHN|nr:ABC transporter substrate-binding protein [Sphingomonas morindae]USI71671.1 ABC transporter substrate-binding protein [Sphingomonas morindae]